MKKIILITVIILFSSVVFAEDIWVRDLHVKSIMLSGSEIYVEFKESITVAPRVYDIWQLKISDSNTVKLYLSILLTAKETQKPVNIIIDGTSYSPISIISLKELKALHYRE